jgi:biopolymer transport protein ExbD
MKFRRRERSEASIELTPLIDVVFLLLIFFMVSTTFIRDTELQVDLPEASGQPQERDLAFVEITVMADGQYAVNDRMLVNSRPETLLRALREATDGDPTRRLFITADGNATHQSVVRVMDVAGQLGLTRLSISTREPDHER